MKQPTERTHEIILEKIKSLNFLWENKHSFQNNKKKHINNKWKQFKDFEFIYLNLY